MNKYKRWYNELISRAKNRELDCYCEKHHIKPRALGGTNKKSNIVKLTYREHFLAHWLLVKFTRDDAKLKMHYAFYMLCKKSAGRIVSSWQYEVARKLIHAKKSIEHRAKISAGQKGVKSLTRSATLKGRIFSPEWRAKISAKAKGRKNPKHSVQMIGNKYGQGKKCSKKTRAKISAANKGNTYWLGRHHTAESRAKISAAHLARI